MVKFKMDVKELAEAMGTISPCTAAPKSVIKMSLLNQQAKTRDGGIGNLVMFLCYDEKKQIAAFSTAREVQMEQDVLEMYIDGKNFSSFATVLGQREGYASFEVDKHMSVDGGNSHIDFALLDAAPTIAREKNTLYQVNMNTPRLKAILRRGGYAYLGGSKGQLNLRYVAIKLDKEAATITVCSSNANMFAMDECANVPFNDTDYPESSHTVLIEGEQLGAVTKMLVDENTLLEVYENQFLLRNGLNICLFRTADDSYPTESLIKMAKEQERECEIKVSVAELLNAIEIFNIARTDNMPLCIIKDLGDNRICLQTKQGNGRTEIEVQKKNSFTEVAFNADFFKSIISKYDKGAEIFMGIGKPKEIIVIKKEKEYAGISCLLPVLPNK